MNLVIKLIPYHLSDCSDSDYKCAVRINLLVLTLGYLVIGTCVCHLSSN